MQNTRKVQRIILTMDGRDGAAYAIALCADGALALTRNGEMLDDAQWDAKQMDECVGELARRSGMDGERER